MRTYLHFENGKKVTSRRSKPPKGTWYLAAHPDPELNKVEEYTDKQGEPQKRAVIDEEKRAAKKLAEQAEKSAREAKDLERAERRQRLEGALVNLNTMSSAQKDSLLEDLVREALGG